MKQRTKTRADRTTYQTKTNCILWKSALNGVKLENVKLFFFSFHRKWELRMKEKKHLDDDVDDYNDMVIRRFVALRWHWHLSKEINSRIHTSHPDTNLHIIQKSNCVNQCKTTFMLSMRANARTPSLKTLAAVFINRSIFFCTNSPPRQLSQNTYFNSFFFIGFMDALTMTLKLYANGTSITRSIE